MRHSWLGDLFFLHGGTSIFVDLFFNESFQIISRGWVLEERMTLLSHVAQHPGLLIQALALLKIADRPMAVLDDLLQPLVSAPVRMFIVPYEGLELSRSEV